MKQTIATTPEQSARLKACEVDPKTADFVWMDDAPNNPRLTLRTEIIEDNNPYIVAPAYSLSRLLSLLPTSITSILGNEYFLELSKVRMHNAWEVQWHNGRCRWPTHDKSGKFCKLWDKSPIEACVKAIEWLTENGYELNEIEE